MIDKTSYKFFDDARRYEQVGLTNPKQPFIPSSLREYKPEIVETKLGVKYFFNGDLDRFETVDGKFQLQLIETFSREYQSRHLIIYAEGRYIQISPPDCESFGMSGDRDDKNRSTLVIGKIGDPLYFDTFDEDWRYRVKRPRDEKLQRLTNASQFENDNQWRQAIDLVESALDQFGYPFLRRAIRSKRDSCLLKFTPDLQAAIARGDHIEQSPKV